VYCRSPPPCPCGLFSRGIKTRGHSPSDEAATQLIWLALRNITAERDRSVREWREAMHQFAIA
jgi:transposase-like protein